jgi:hypothetical protein
MKAGIIEATSIAVAIGASMAVFAQTTERPGQPATSPSSASETQQPTAPAGVSVTLVGCVEREADYRRAQDAGRGGAAGTGAGVGNEYVLVTASTAIAGATPPDALPPGAPPAEPGTVRTAGMAGGAYELTGPAEGQLEQYVGRRVETVGRPDVPSTAAASPSGRPARPAGGVDITGQFQEKNCVARTGASAQPRPERVLVESLDQGAVGAAPRGRR